MNQQRESGAAAIVTVLMTAILLMGVVTVTAQMTVSTRRTASDDTRSFQSLLATESALSGFLVWAQQHARELGKVGTCTQSSPAAQQTCLLEAWLATYPSGTGITLRVVDLQLSSSGGISAVDIEAAGTSRGASSRVLQQYTLTKLDLKPLNIPAAVVSYPGVDIGGNSQIDGKSISTSLSNSDGLYLNYGRATRTSTGLLTPGSTTTLNLNGDAEQQKRTARLRPGDYVQLPLATGPAGTLSSPVVKGRFRVVSNAGGQLSVEALSLSGVATPYLPSSETPLDFVMNGLITSQPGRLTMRSTETFITGDTVAVKVGAVTYTTTVTSPGTTDATGTTSIGIGNWSPSAPPTPIGSTLEGLPVVKSTRGVITAGIYDGGKYAPAGGVLTGGLGAEFAPSPLNDAMFIKTFGMSPAELKGMAEVIPESEFGREEAQLKGLTWLTGTGGSVNLNNEKLSGKGILIVDGDLTLNQNQTTECGLQGVIYVRGNLRIQGNLGLCGAIVVEGSILNSEGTVVTGVDYSDTVFSGTGRKVTYDPQVLFDITGGSGTYNVALQPGTWRQR